MAVRCPECGRQQPAGVIAQPWRYRRLKSVGLRLWWLLMACVALGGGVGGLVGMSQSTAYASTLPVAKRISQAYQLSDPVYLTERTWDGGSYQARYEVPLSWWNDVGKEQFTTNRSVFGDIDVLVLTDWLWFLLIAPIFAVFFRIVFSQSHLVVVVVIALCSTAIAAWGIYLAVMFTYSFQIYPHPHGLAMKTAGLPIAWMTFAVGLLSYIVGCMIAPRMLGLLGRFIPALPPMLGREPDE